MKDETIYNEMGQTSNIDIIYSVSYNGGFYVKTKKELKGRGIKFAGITSINPRNTYHLTKLAFEKLKKNNDVCCEASL